MATLTYAQLRAYAVAAGAADPDTAAAVALAESGGVTTKHNPIPPDDSYGVWQINMRGDLGPDRRKKLGISSNSQLYDPATNARAMSMISKGGTNFSPWTTYKNGKYRKYLGDSAGPAVIDAGLTDIPGDIWGGVKGLVGGIGGGLAGGLSDIAGIPGKVWDDVTDVTDVVIDAANWMGKASNWLRVAYVVGGAAVVLVGLAILLEKPVMNAKGGAAKIAALAA